MIRQNIRSFPITSLAVFMERIREIQDMFQEENCNFCRDLSRNSNRVHVCANSSAKECPMWFRGHEYEHYTLLPSLYRKQVSQSPVSVWGRYSPMHLREDARDQVFRSRTYHIMQNSIETSLEWQEVKQHHRANTRFLDWSESAFHALIFALEALLDPRSTSYDVMQRKDTFSPTVWVLNPKALNATIYCILSDQLELLHRAEPTLANDMQTALLAGYSSFFLSSFCNEPNTSGYLSLSVLNAHRAERGDYQQRLGQHELNPFHHLLLRYYSDALPVDAGILPPMATLATFHSKRIEAQRGVFTVFPVASDASQPLSNLLDRRALENQPTANKYLACLNIVDPEHLAYDIRRCGIDIGWVYPEADWYALRMESNTS